MHGFQSNGSELTIPEGKSISLTCETLSPCRPNATIRWNIGEEDITPFSTLTVQTQDPEKFVSNSTLTFQPLRNHTGKRLLCSANNLGDDVYISANERPILTLHCKPHLNTHTLIHTPTRTHTLTLSLSLTHSISAFICKYLYYLWDSL